MSGRELRERALKPGRIARAAFRVAVLAGMMALAACGASRPTSALITAPTLSITPSAATVSVGGRSVAFAASLDGAGASVIWEVNGVTGGDPTSGTISASGQYTSPAMMPTSPTVEVTAVDSTDPSVSASAALTLVPPATSVTVVVSPSSALVLAGSGTQVFTATVSNASNAAVTWQVNGLTGGNATLGTISASGLYTAPATPPAQSTLTITAVSVEDPTQSGSAAATVVTSTTMPPLISGTPPTTASAGNAYTFTPTASSPRGGTLTFSITNQPSWATFSTTTGRLSGTPAATDAGIDSGIVVSVNDGTLTASLPPFSITVTAAPPPPPTISGTPATSVVAGHAYTFTPSAASPRGAALTFSIANGPSWASFNTSTGHLSGTPAAANVGTYANVSISVSDGTGSATLAPFTITVQPGTTGSATLAWTSPTTRTDGSALTNLAGFNIYYGTSPGSYPNKIAVANPGLTTFVVTNLLGGSTYFFVATAYDSTGAESAYSNIGSKTIP